MPYTRANPAPGGSSTALSTRPVQSTALQRKKRPRYVLNTKFICLLYAAIAHHLYSLWQPRLRPQPLHNSRMDGQEFVDEWLERHPQAMKAALGITPSTFLLLLQELQDHASFYPSRHVSPSEMLAIFLYIARDGTGVRRTAMQFNRSYDTIHRSFHYTLSCFIRRPFYHKWIHMPNADDGLPFPLNKDGRFTPFFDRCIGAIDGTHIPAVPPLSSREAYRDRSGKLSLNILAACTFDLRFCYVLSGWEGSAHDWKVYHDAISHDLAIPEGSYLLGDAGFNPSKGLLVPYSGVRYHLKEWGRAGLRPQRPVELYNLRHATLRNVIERIFGVIKRKFKLFVRADQYSVPVQARIVLALCVLHNCIRTWDVGDPELDIDRINPTDTSIRQGLPQIYYIHRQSGEVVYEDNEQRLEREGAESEELQDDLAKAMWDDYQLVLASRRRRRRNNPDG